MSSARLRNSLLAARDRRQALIDRHLRDGHPSLLMLALNIPGPDKQRTGTAGLFALASERLGVLFPGLELLERESDPLGPWGLFALSQQPRDAKRSCVGLEESLPAGRLVDLDIYDGDGNQIDRSSLDLPPRSCLLCHRPARECIRLGRHPYDELSAKTDELLSDFRLR